MGAIERVEAVEPEGHGSCSLAALQVMIFDQIRALRSLDLRDAKTVDAACMVSEQIEKLGAVAVANAQTAIKVVGLRSGLGSVAKDARAASMLGVEDA